MTENHTIKFNLIKTAFTSEHIPALFQGLQTHDPAMRLCCQLAHHTSNEECLKTIIQSALPAGYPFTPNQNLYQELDGLIEGAFKQIKLNREELQGHQMKEDKEKKIAGIFMELLDNVGAVIFKGAMQKSFISIKLSSGAYLHLPIHSRQAKLFARQLYYKFREVILSDTKLKEVLDTADAIAQFEHTEEPVYLRIAEKQDVIYIDRGSDDGSTVRICRDGWKVTFDNHVKFFRTSGFGVLPAPISGGSLKQLQELLHLDDQNWVLFLAFLLNCLKPNGPYMCLLVEGEQGSGKSLLCSLIKCIIDPNLASKMRLPDNERDLMIQAKEYFLLSFDNASFVREVISDMLCSLSTGGGFSTRKLYTDDELQVFNFSRPYIINGISNIGHRPDLLERAIHLKLKPMPQGTRKTEREIIHQFNEMLPQILGCLYDCIACALGRLGSVPIPRNVRMADCAHWLTAAEPAAGLADGAFITTLTESQNDLMIDRIVNQPLAIRLMKLLQNHGRPFKGYIGDLHDEIKEGGYSDKNLPATPAHLSSALDRLKPALQKVGIFIKFGEKNRRGRPITIWLEEDADKEPKPFDPPPC